MKNTREMHRCLQIRTQIAGVEEDISQVVSRPEILRVNPGTNCRYLKFEQAEVRVLYECGKTGETRNHRVRFCPSLDAVKRGLKDPALRIHLFRYPEMHYIWKPGAHKNMPVWTDAHTADDWWKFQVILHVALRTQAKCWPLEKNEPPPDRRQHLSALGTTYRTHATRCGSADQNLVPTGTAFLSLVTATTTIFSYVPGLIITTKPNPPGNVGVWSIVSNRTIMSSSGWGRRLSQQA